jgi:ABC-2 type transport system ATP-binding protein
VQDVTMRFREHTAVDGVTTAIEQDAITGLLGRSGAGMTSGSSRPIACDDDP